MTNNRKFEIVAQEVVSGRVLESRETEYLFEAEEIESEFEAAWADCKVQVIEVDTSWYDR